MTLPYLPLVTNNKNSLRKGSRCIFCFSDVPFVSIKEWIDNDDTAICPLCGIDAVVPLSKLPTDKSMADSILIKWKKMGFSTKCSGCGMTKQGIDCACWGVD